MAHQLATWYDPINFEYTCPSVSIDDLQSGGDERFYDFKNWKRVGPVCDAPNARSILADDVRWELRLPQASKTESGLVRSAINNQKITGLCGLMGDHKRPLWTVQAEGRG